MKVWHSTGRGEDTQHSTIFLGVATMSLMPPRGGGGLSSSELADVFLQQTYSNDTDWSFCTNPVNVCSSLKHRLLSTLQPFCQELLPTNRSERGANSVIY
uniref:Uncharacterized protein n=1 Tax=Sphaerodactylus townsendi TaxID=933632 RepID=A0ACB8EBG3_9SAUR